LLKACNIPGFLEETTGLAAKLNSVKVEDFEDFTVDEFDDADEPRED